MLQPLDLDALRNQFSQARPVPYVKIDDFLFPEAAMEISQAYPAFDLASQQGKMFKTVNERKKVQITESSRFSKPVAEFNALLASQKFLNDLGVITGIPNILADNQLAGGGIHITGPGGRLDVHVDFNYIEDRKLHRRLNLLLYLNPIWRDEWGGQFQLWDKDVKNCEASFAPIFNRCVIFETSNVSYHGVVPISPASQYPRQSFATYYYTKEAPAHWDGHSHSTIFKARPEEKVKGLILMPAEAVRSKLQAGVRTAKNAIKAIVGR